MLVAADSLQPVDLAHDAIAALTRRHLGGSVTSEFLPSQVEHATPICRSGDEATEDLRSFRGALAEWANAHGAIAVPSGTPFLPYPNPPHPDAPRYRRIARDVGMLADEHLVNGVHVHVGIEDDDDRAWAMCGLRAWLPVILALSANSPFWNGRDTAYASWRAIQTRRWTTNGIPPALHTADEHRALYRRMLGIGATQKYCSASWSIRLSERFPTIEVRICDAQLRTEDSVALALIIRGLTAAVLRADHHRDEPHHVLDSELWHAARYGLSEGTFDPASGAHASSDVVMRSLRDAVAAAEWSPTDAERVEAFLSDAAAGRSGAWRQRRALDDGPRMLADLYRSALVA